MISIGHCGACGAMVDETDGACASCRLRHDVVVLQRQIDALVAAQGVTAANVANLLAWRDGPVDADERVEALEEDLAIERDRADRLARAITWIVETTNDTGMKALYGWTGLVLASLESHLAAKAHAEAKARR